MLGRGKLYIIICDAFAEVRKGRLEIKKNKKKKDNIDCACSPSCH